MALDLINGMSKTWEPEKYHNDYRETLQKWLDKQAKTLAKQGKKVTNPVRRQEAVVDFISLLKESMQKNKTKDGISGKRKKAVKK